MTVKAGAADLAKILREHQHKRDALQAEWNDIVGDIDALLSDMDAPQPDKSESERDHNVDEDNHMMAMHDIEHDDRFKWKKDGKDYRLLNKAEGEAAAQKSALRYETFIAEFEGFKLQKKAELQESAQTATAPPTEIVKRNKGCAWIYSFVENETDS